MDSILLFLNSFIDHIIQLPISQQITLAALPIILLLALAEWWHFRGKGKFELKDSIASIAMGGAYILVAEGIMVVAIVIPAFDWFYQFRLTTVEINLWSLIALVLLVDFCFYLFHLGAHRIRFLWGVHEVHHGSTYYNYTVAFRQSILYAVIGVYAFFLPAVLIGYPTQWVLAVLGINLLMQIWVHTQWINRLPKAFEWLINTPSNHRVHHGSNTRYIDKNMGGIFMVWDHLFGTYEREDENEPVVYGVVSQLDKPISTNPVELTFREYKSMFADVMKPGPLKYRLKHLWAGPEWIRPVESTIHSSSEKQYP